jgi:hypothetical protein
MNRNMKKKEIERKGGTRSRNWLKHYVTSRKVAGSRPDEVNEFFLIYVILPAAPGL